MQRRKSVSLEVKNATRDGNPARRSAWEQTVTGEKLFNWKFRMHIGREAGEAAPLITGCF